MLHSLQAQGSLVNVNDALVINTTGFGGIGLQLTGTWTGVVSFEGTIDGGTWAAIRLTPFASSTAVSSASATGMWNGAISGLVAVRVRFSTASSGIVGATLEALPNPPGAGGGGGAAGAVTIADGDDAAEGSTTDAKVTGDNAGTVSAKLRGINTILADVWDSVNHWFKVSIQNATLAVTQSGVWNVGTTTATSATSALSNVAIGATSFTVLAANAARLNATFYNDSQYPVTLKLNAGAASSSSFSDVLLPGQFVDLATHFGVLWVGGITGIAPAGSSGTLRVTEFTA